MKNVQLLARKCRERRELPAVMVKKSGKSCRKHGGRKKKLQDACKLAENGSASHARKKLLKKQAIARVRMGRSCLARVSRQPLFGIRCGNGSFCLPLFWGGGVQDGLCHIHLNGEGPKKFRQQQGDWRAKLLESQRRVLGRQGRVGQGLAAERGGNGAGAAPPQIKGRLLHKFCPTGQQGA